MAETNARPFSRERVDFFLFTAARQLRALLVMTVSGILGFFCLLTSYPVALLMEIKVFLAAWKSSFGLTWKG